jgi:REP element-mobilizing transposase RayT
MKYLDTFEPDTFFHVYNRAVGMENLFRTEENFRYFLTKYEAYTENVWDTYAYCLMPNHFHFLVKIKSLDTLRKLTGFVDVTHEFVMQKFSNFLNAYAKAYNRRYGRKGALFLDFTKRKAVKYDQYLVVLINYIHQNPVHHGYCRFVDEWIYSSYQACLSEKDSKIKRQEILDFFGSKAALQKFHKEHAALLQDDLEFL